MLFAYGWVMVRSSRACYKDVVSLDNIDDLDDQVDVEDRNLWQSLRNLLESLDDPWLKWQFFERMNNVKGVLQFFTSRNHRSSSMWELMRWIAENGTGSYGIIYVHDDDDVGRIENTNSDHNETDHSNVFRVWRILNGTIDELDDPFLSPIVPRINPSEYA